MSTIKVNRIENTATTDGGIDIDSSGKVGIGTSSPGVKLHVNGSTPTLRVSHGTSQVVEIKADTSASILRTTTNHPLLFGTNDTERMRIDSSGRVGIGTSSPTTNLEINGGTNNNIVRIVSTDANANIEFADNTTTSGCQIGANGDNLKFGISGSEAMRIDSSGNVGIGTTSPQHRLSVERDIGIYRASSDPTLSLSVGGTIASPTKTYNLLIDDSDSDKLQIRDGSTARVTLDSSGNVGIGTSSPVIPIQLNNYGGLDGNGNQLIISNNTYFSSGDKATKTGFSTRIDLTNLDGSIRFLNTAASSSANAAITLQERLRIDSSGKVLINTTAPSQYADRQLTVGDTSLSSSNIEIRSATNGWCGLAFSDSTASDANSYRGTIEYSHSTNHMQFRTDAVERMRIKNNGQWYINTGGGAPNASTSGIEFGPGGYIYNVVDSNTVQYLNRNGNDGTIVEFRQANQAEGSISVSGSTVSYNGGHLSRWSQLAGGVERTEILRGSVLSNLDEMCEWAYDAQDAVLYTEEDELPEGASVGDVKTPAVAAGTEDNEQLNRMKVSDVEGDKNVSGVFQSWDDDDDTYVNDFYCAMTGDFVIRIAQGTTVARGDLLMSAGDGTAKPQDDDIVRSKTIAKVTSTTVSTTYSDNSYCVPCVLMAC